MSAPIRRKEGALYPVDKQGNQLKPFCLLLIGIDFGFARVLMSYPQIVLNVIA